MFKYSNDIPIYIQIMDNILKDIISGRYAPGEQIPSVRELAKIYSANPNTCQKAVAELAEKGYLISLSTNGKCVNNNNEIIASYRQKILNDLVNSFINETKSFGFSTDDIITILIKKGEEKNGDCRN